MTQHAITNWKLAAIYSCCSWAEVCWVCFFWFNGRHHAEGLNLSCRSRKSQRHVKKNFWKICSKNEKWMNHNSCSRLLNETMQVVASLGSGLWLPEETEVCWRNYSCVGKKDWTTAKIYTSHAHSHKTTLTRLTGIQCLPHQSKFNKPAVVKNIFAHLEEEEKETNQLSEKTLSDYSVSMNHMKHIERHYVNAHIIKYNYHDNRVIAFRDGQLKVKADIILSFFVFCRVALRAVFFYI